MRMVRHFLESKLLNTSRNARHEDQSSTRYGVAAFKPKGEGRTKAKAKGKGRNFLRHPSIDQEIA